MLPPLLAYDNVAIKSIFFLLTMYWLGMAGYLLVGASRWIGVRWPFVQNQMPVVRTWYWPVGFCIASYLVLSLSGWFALHAIAGGLSNYWTLSWPGLVIFFLQVALVSWFGPVGVILAASLLIGCILMSLNYSRAALVILISGLWLASGLLFPIHPLSRAEVAQATFGEPFPYYIQPQPETLQPCQDSCSSSYPSSLKFHAFSGQKTNVDWPDLMLSYGFMLATTIAVICGLPMLYHKAKARLFHRAAPLIPIL